MNAVLSGSDWQTPNDLIARCPDHRPSGFIIDRDTWIGVYKWRPNSPKGAHMPRPAPAPPDPGALSGLVAGLSFIGGIGGANALAPYPRPGASPSQLRQYFTLNAGPTRLNAAGQAISAVSLARFTAVLLLFGGYGPYPVFAFVSPGRTGQPVTSR